MSDTVGSSVCATQAFDQHLNMILSEVEEMVTTLELDEETFEEIYRVRFLIHSLKNLSCLRCVILYTADDS